ncbi:MAG: TIGR01777 family oxidoreductase [Deltaproteobacteria bacterium]|nr:TIGR01777 family oxidoreductase [Deltaproteobacteria bacterium]
MDPTLGKSLRGDSSIPEETRDTQHVQRILVSGASGLVGGRLVPFLRSQGHTVLPLSRGNPHPGSVHWRPDQGVVNPEDLEGVDAAVHLAGESLAARRWSMEQKAAIRASRVDSTTLLARTLAGLRRKPRVLVCASAIGVYGDRGEEVLDEQSSPGAGFLASVCQAWEAACDPARQAGIRVVHMRMGMVLASEGGALKKMLLPFQLGLGGPIGQGGQYLSWAALDDVVRAVGQTLRDPRLEGPVNLTAPHPVTSREFAQTLGRVLRRPAVLPLPAWVVKMVFGEMGQSLLLEGQRVLPKRLTDLGFRFSFSTVEEALNRECRAP